MRALALDIGEVRVGIAASDASGRIASPVKVLPAAEVLGHAKTFRRILEDYEPDVLVCGRPQTLSGEDGPQAERLMAQADSRRLRPSAGVCRRAAFLGGGEAYSQGRGPARARHARQG